MPKKGFKHSEASRIKISNSHKGQIPWNKGKSSWSKGKHFSQEHKNNISKALKNKKKTREHIRKMIKSKTGQGMGKNNPAWKGGRIKTYQGYIIIHRPKHPSAKDNHVAEHRLVVERIIGRYLLPTEEVHHLGERCDNRLAMLIAFSTKSAHQRFERNKNVKPEEIVFDGRKLKVHLKPPQSG